VSSLNVSGFTTLSNNNTIYGTLNISGRSQFINDTTLLSSLNISEFTTLNNNVSLVSSLNVSGFTLLEWQNILSIFFVLIQRGKQIFHKNFSGSYVKHRKSKIENLSRWYHRDTIH
jgi:hypothetical protein